MKNIIKTLTLVLAATALTLTSCTDKCKDTECPVGQMCDDGDCIVDPSADQHEDAYGDVLIKKMDMMGVKYKLIVFAGGATIVEEGSKVITPSGTEYPLTKYWVGDGLLRNFDVPESDIKPEVGEYTFILKFADGFEKTITDVLENDDVTLPNITVTHSGNEVTVSWDEITDADFICVKLTELDIADTKPFFKQAMLPKNTTSYTFTTTTTDAMPGWMRSPDDLQAGTEYWLSVAGKTVEEGKDLSGMSKDFAVSACSKKLIAW